LQYAASAKANGLRYAIFVNLPKSVDNGIAELRNGRDPLKHFFYRSVLRIIFVEEDKTIEGCEHIEFLRKWGRVYQD